MEEIQQGTTDVIRQTSRYILKVNRQNQRVEESERRRFLENKTGANEDDIGEIIKKLKTKAAVSAEELAAVKNSLWSSSKNIELFLHTHGALHGLVRELTGSDAAKQTLAAACCCNLALGDDRAVQVVCKAAGSYLVTSVDNLNKELAISCIWAIGNLAGSNAKVCDILIVQGALSKLISLLNHINDEDFREALLYSLVHFTHTLKQELRSDLLLPLVEAVVNSKRDTTSYQLLFLLSCHPNFLSLDVVKEAFVKSMFEEVPSAYQEYCKQCENKDYACSNFVYILRILANLCCVQEVADLLLNFCVICNLNSLLKSIMCSDKEDTKHCVLWLVGNIYNYSSESTYKHNFVSSVMSVIK